MVSKWYDVGFIVYVVLFDFVEASNIVSHHLLLDMFRLLGICSPFIDWIVDFLVGIRSSFMDVRSGSPQRSVLCLLLFLLFVNHLLTDVISKCKFFCG